MASHSGAGTLVEPFAVGLHTAEVARRGATVAGGGVALTQDVAARAERGEVWVTSTLRDLTAGSGFNFQSRDHLEASSLGRAIELDAVTARTELATAEREARR